MVSKALLKKISSKLKFDLNLKETDDAIQGLAQACSENKLLYKPIKYKKTWICKREGLCMRVRNMRGKLKRKSEREIERKKIEIYRKWKKYI